MATINTPNVIRFNHDEVCEAIKQAAIKKNPELEDEEFEIDVTYDSYSKILGASIQSL